MINNCIININAIIYGVKQVKLQLFTSDTISLLRNILMQLGLVRNNNFEISLKLGDALPESSTLLECGISGGSNILIINRAF